MRFALSLSIFIFASLLKYTVDNESKVDFRDQTRPRQTTLMYNMRFVLKFSRFITSDRSKERYNFNIVEQ